MILILTSWVILSALLIGINIPFFSWYIRIGKAPKKCTNCRCRELRAFPSNFDLQRDFNEFMERIKNEGVSNHHETSENRINSQEVSNQYDFSDDRSFKVSIESDTEESDYNDKDESNKKVSNRMKITASRSKCPNLNNSEGTKNSDFINFMKSMNTLSFEDKETMRIKYMNLQKILEEPCVLDNSECSTNEASACVDESDNNELKSAIKNNKSDFLVEPKIPGSLRTVSLQKLYPNAKKEQYQNVANNLNYFKVKNWLNPYDFSDLKEFVPLTGNNPQYLPSCTTTFADRQIMKIGNVLVSKPRQFTVQPAQKNFCTDDESESNEVDDVVSKQNL